MTNSRCPHVDELLDQVTALEYLHVCLSKLYVLPFVGLNFLTASPSPDGGNIPAVEAFPFGSALVIARATRETFAPVLLEELPISRKFCYCE